MLTLDPPCGHKKILLHSCCAPCSGAVLECLLANGMQPVVFFSNSNIVPFAEYELRRSELARYCESLGVTMVDDEYDHDVWRDYVLAINDGTTNEARRPQTDRARELAAAPERGERCLRCFEFRLRRAARYAEEHGIPVLATTLASSRWKDLDQVNEAGARIAGQAGNDGTFGNDGQPRPEEHGVLFWPQNWRKGGLQPRRNEIIAEQHFYNQNWCGCEFSRKHDPNPADPDPDTDNDRTL